MKTWASGGGPIFWFFGAVCEARAMIEINFEGWFFHIVMGKTDMKWYFVTKIVLTYCEKKLF